MKKVFAAALAAALSLTVLAGCSNKNAAADRTSAELTQIYADAITANGGEMVEYNPVISEAREDDGSAMMLELMGLNAADLEAFGISFSMMNVKAYGIAAVMPAEGKEQAVKDALQGFIDQKCVEFETYLPDQYDVAQNARLETLEDGTILMVMTEGQNEVFQGIAEAIQTA